MPKNTARLGKNGMKITTISALIYESKLALSARIAGTQILFFDRHHPPPIVNLPSIDVATYISRVIQQQRPQERSAN